MPRERQPRKRGPRQPRAPRKPRQPRQPRDPKQPRQAKPPRQPKPPRQRRTRSDYDPNPLRGIEWLVIMGGIGLVMVLPIAVILLAFEVIRWFSA